MRLLLDTHAFLWFINDDFQLSQSAKTLLEDSGNELFLSYASIWEMAIKISLGKLSAPLPFAPFMNEQLELNEISLLNFSVKQIGVVATLPFYHRDPFDRMLAAQALSEQLPLVSRDTIFKEYKVNLLW